MRFGRKKAKIAEYDRIKPYERRSGGFRADEHNAEYRLSSEQLITFEEMNLAIGSDREFWTWFRAYRKSENITPYIRKYAYEDDTSWWKSWTPASWKKTEDGSWWQASYRKGMSWATDHAQKLAVAMQHVASVIRTVDDNIPPMKVDWADKDVSSTDLTGKSIAINPEPVVNTKLDDGTALDIVTGYALHEASHALHTKHVAEQLRQPTPVTPEALAGFLGNILEDVRIEGLTSKEYPGFAEYFRCALNYNWENRPAEANPSFWGTLPQKINTIIVIARWAEHVRTAEWTTDGKTVEKVLGHASFDAEIPWWKDWVSDYVAGKTTYREAVIAAIEHLRDEEVNEMERKEAEAKNQAEKMDRAIDDLLDQLEREFRRWLKEKDIPVPCDEAHGDGTEVSEADRAEARELVEANFRKVTISKNFGSHDIFHSRPIENDDSRSFYRPKMDPVIERIRAAIELRPELPQWADRLRRSGDLDEEELFRFHANDYRLFEQKIIEHYPQASITLLVDMSGSMSHRSSAGVHPRIATAQELAQLFVEALRTMQGIAPKVMGHTGNVDDDEVQLYELWVTGDPLSRLGLAQALPHCENYDGHAISWCVDDLIVRSRPQDERLLIVLSDGQPAGTDYGGVSAMKHVRAVTDEAEHRGVTVIQIAISSDLNAVHQSTMFRHWVPFTTTQALPTLFKRVLDKALNHAA